MPNPTTPFSWQMPTASDLVTDLPADFETFGQAVATSMADLLGGTTGQVLSKASNTDMDFTWVTSDDANAIQNAIVDAKGDLIAATAADTPARLAVGTNGQVLTADSTAATGLAWATPSGGFTYATYTPTFTGFTKGNASITARWAQSGKAVNVLLAVTLGNTSSVTGSIIVSLPVTGSSNAISSRGVAGIRDSGVRIFSAAAEVISTTEVELKTIYAGATYASEDYADATNPMTWTTNDGFFMSFTYEAA